MTNFQKLQKSTFWADQFPKF